MTPTPAPLPDRCSPADGCLTCGDVAVAVTALAAGADEARCADADGREDVVALELVGPVARGDRLLVHAGVALTRLEAP